MRFSVAAVAATLAATAQARIYGISVPETIKPGDEVDLKIISQGYIQRVDDIAIAFGYNSKAAAYPDTLGNLLDSFYLGPDESNLGQAVIVKSVTFPSSIASGEGVVSAGLYSLYGVSKGPTLSNYNVTITFGDSTSTTYKNSF